MIGNNTIITLAEAMVLARGKSKLEKRRAHYKRYYDHHPEKMRTKNREYYQKHRDIICERSRG